jgi:hypothetical protein
MMRDMEKRRPQLASTAIALALIAMLSLGYFGAYRLSGIRKHGKNIVVYVYSYKWQAMLFTPASKLEAWITQSNVDTAWVYH